MRHRPGRFWTDAEARTVLLEYHSQKMGPSSHESDPMTYRTGKGWSNRGTEGSAVFARFGCAFVAIRSMHSRDVLRGHSERGASMVEYALLVGLIAVVAVVLSLIHI